MAARLGQAGALRRAHGYSKATGRRLRRRGGIRLHDGSPRSAVRAETAGRAEEGRTPRVAQTFQSGVPTGDWKVARTRRQGMSALHGSHEWTLYHLTRSHWRSDARRGSPHFPDVALQRRLVIPSGLVPTRRLARLGEVYSLEWHECLCLVRWRGTAQI